MADYAKINLASLNHKIADFGQKGSKETIKCIVIPIKKNHLFMSDKGNVYMDLVLFKRKEPQKNEETGAVEQTHLIKQSLPKEVREKMSEKEKMEQPIIGNALIWDGKYEEQEAVEDDSIETSGDDDLPF